MTDLIRLSLEQSLEVQDAARRNKVSLAELKKLTGGDNLRRAINSLFPKQRRYCSVALPKMVSKTRREVYEYLKETYGEDRLAKIPDDLKELPKKMKDGNWHSFFGSLRDRDGEADVPIVYWNESELVRYADWLDHCWSSFNRAVLLEN